MMRLAYHLNTVLHDYFNYSHGGGHILVQVVSPDRTEFAGATNRGYEQALKYAESYLREIGCDDVYFYDYRKYWQAIWMGITLLSSSGLYEVSLIRLPKDAELLPDAGQDHPKHPSLLVSKQKGVNAYIAWCEDEGLKPDFTDCDLADINFSCADLTGVSFVRANLLRTNFFSCSCRFADFSKAEMYQTVTHHSDFYGADFHSTSVMDTDFGGARNIIALYFEGLMKRGEYLYMVRHPNALRVLVDGNNFIDLDQAFVSDYIIEFLKKISLGMEQRDSYNGIDS